MLTETIAQTKDNLNELLEVNQALAQDLDVSRRLVAELGRERDALRRQVDELEARNAATAERARAAEQTLRALVGDLRRSEMERASLALERDDSVAALAEIRCHLLELPNSLLSSAMR